MQPHTEEHFSGSEIVRDVVIGMAQGRSALQTAVVGSLAAAAAFLIAKSIA